MRYAYEADFTCNDGDGAWYVEFHGFGGSAYADGGTLEEAARNAAEVLELTICDYLDGGVPLPRPEFSDPPKSVVSVEVDDADIAASRCMSVTDAAEALGVTAGRVSQLLTSGQLEAFEHGGRRLVTIASVEARRRSRPPAHRPRLSVVDGAARSRSLEQA